MNGERNFQAQKWRKPSHQKGWQSIHILFKDPLNCPYTHMFTHTYGLWPYVRSGKVLCFKRRYIYSTIQPGWKMLLSISCQTVSSTFLATFSFVGSPVWGWGVYKINSNPGDWNAGSTITALSDNHLNHNTTNCSNGHICLRQPLCLQAGKKSKAG